MTAPVEDCSPGGSTSRSLLAEAKLADPAAWERLVRLYAPLVASWCRRWGVAEQDIADLLQDVFSAVARSLSRFHSERPADTFRGWLSTIARNKTHDYYRRRTREPDATGGSEATFQLQHFPDRNAGQDLSEEESPSAAADGILLDILLRNALESIRGEFHEQTWQAFWGVVVEGRTAAEVADELGMKPGTVRVAKSRILLRLRRELGDMPA
jgi:RNA polymerase sigma-70 factor (ECF subfamily)